MISTYLTKQLKVNRITREKMLFLVKTGLDVKAFRFTRQAAMAWLTSFPGDLEINLLYAKALLMEGRASHAAPVIQKILHTDPEFFEAAILAEAIFEKSNPSFVPFITGTIRALGGSPINKSKLPVWADKMYSIRLALIKNQFEFARDLLFDILDEAEKSELVSIAHLQVSEKLDDRATLLNLARLYHARWPDCIQIGLILSKAWMEVGEEDQAVELLHSCAANDTSAQVPERMWGKDLEFRPLYPVDMQVDLELAIPAEVAGKMGLNQLTSGVEVEKIKDTTSKPLTEVASYDGYKILPTPTEAYPSHPGKVTPIKKHKDPILADIEYQFKKIAHEINQPAITHTDGRFPVHVLLSMKSGLERQFGEQATRTILEELGKLTKVVQEKVGCTSLLLLPDDLASCGKFNITPVDSLDPWKIKLALVDLDKTLEKSGQRIGSVLIIGGDAVVPFHRLPNPTDDSDTEIPSDNPYGTLDTNYFVSDWPVGRLPGEVGSDPGLLMTQIRNNAAYHAGQEKRENWVNSIFRILFFWNQTLLSNLSNIGYTASVWRRSSLAAFRPIGEGKNLFLSPSGTLPNFDLKKLAYATVGYFNVHGVEDGSDWYGQKDPLDSSSGPDFPVALKPSDLQRLSGIPRIVFCEACYGGHIFEKREDESIALTMLGKGVMAMVSSTVISYGSVTTPLIGADLMGYLVMKNLKNGLSIGNSMSTAKVEFIREMNRRQGYLDGEDQKSLISFVLYGDPLVAYDPQQAIKKVTPRDLNHPVVKTISDNPNLDNLTEQLVPKMVSQAKSLVKDYLPGIEYAEVRVMNQKFNLASSGELGKPSKVTNSPNSDRVVVSFSKQFTQSQKIHRQYARVTLDKEGKMVKLAVSR